MSMSAIVRQAVEKVHVVLRTHVCMSEQWMFKNNPIYIYTYIHIVWSGITDVGNHISWMYVSKGEKKKAQNICCW